jgi:F-type H+-transporting ATPase subunit b
LEQLGINLGYLLVQILNFGILFLVLYGWVYKPLLNMLEKRRQTVAQGLEDARVAAEARANAEREAEHVLNDAQVKAAEILREANERAEAVEREIRQDAEKEIVQARESALAEVEQERNLILSNLRGQVVSLAMAAAQRLIGESLMVDDERQHALLKEFFSGVRGGQVSTLEGVKLDNATAEVTSALPLNEEEKEIIRKEILKTGEGAGGNVNFRVDPSILGGLVVRINDRVIDASVNAQLQELRQTLQ